MCAPKPHRGIRSAWRKPSPMRKESEEAHPGLKAGCATVGVILVPSGPSYSIPTLYNELYGIALWLRDESVHWQERNESVPSCRCALACLVHCFLALEAYINTYAAWYARFPKSPISVAVLGRLEGLPPDVKWLLFPVLFTGRSVFDPGQEPFQSFMKLKRMRDNFIVHHKPKVKRESVGHTVDADGRWIVGVRGIELGETAISACQDPPCDAEAARWACDLVRAMVKRLVESADEVPNAPKPPAIEPFPGTSSE